MEISTYGLCTVSDQYFRDFPSIRHVSNKYEQRPYFLAIKEESGIIWLIPLSSQVDNYRAKIEADKKKYGESIFNYIARVKGKDSAFLVGNAIPVTERYIVKPFTVKGVPYVIQDKTDVKKLTSMLRRYLAMVNHGTLKPGVDIIGIKKKLIEQENKTE